MAQIKAGETAAVIARELAEQTKRNLQAGDIMYTVKAMVQLVDLLDVQLRNLTPGGKDSAARSLNKVRTRRRGLRRSLPSLAGRFSLFSDLGSLKYPTLPSLTSGKTRVSALIIS